jgi:macrolide-specific efflux system membrane fusion protein
MNATALAPRKPRGVLVRYGLPLVVIALLAGGGWWGWQQYNAGKNSRDQYQIATVQRGDIQDLVTATGTVQPRDYVDVGAQVSGQLKKLHVEVGAFVQSGDLLAEIDPTVLLATLDARRASLQNLQATQADRESSLSLALLQETRQKNLMAADATTKESLQQAEAAVRSARAQIDAIKAQISQTQSQMRADEANLNYTKIYAPMTGTVVSVTARQGQTLNANQSAPIILRVADLTTMTVQTQVSEAEVSKLRQGMEVYFTTLGGQGRRWYGELRKVEPTPTVTNNVVLYNALFDVVNTNNQLLPNMTTQVFFIAASAQDVLLVPTAAVTMARQGQGGQGNRQRGAGEAASGASQAASGAQRRQRAAEGTTVAASEAARPASRPAGAKPASAPAAAMPDFAAMSPEERRAAFEKMTPEERQAMRERRRAQREAEGGGNAPPGDARPAGGNAGGNAGTRAAAAPKASADPDASFRALASEGAARPPAAGASAPRRAGVTGGFTSTGAQRAPRKGTVKVIDAEGKIEERQVEVGVVTRVQAQVLSGLNEGDQVIAGLKPPPGAQRAVAAGQQQQGGLQQNPPGTGNAGGARSR